MLYLCIVGGRDSARRLLDFRINQARRGGRKKKRNESFDGCAFAANQSGVNNSRARVARKVGGIDLSRRGSQQQREPRFPARRVS